MLSAARGMALIATSLDMFRFDDGMDKITTPPMSYRPSIYSEVTKGQLLNFFGCGSARARATLIFLSLAQWRARADPEQEKVQTFIPMGLGWVSISIFILFIPNLFIIFASNIFATFKLMHG